MLDTAIAFAATAHAGQKRKYDKLPYIVHPIEVMSILHNQGVQDEAMLIAAVLHDVVEDTIVSLDTIERRFGADVAGLVDELTDKFADPGLGNRKLRKQLERNRIAETSARAQTIKCADFVSNTASIVRYDLNFALIYLTEKSACLKVMTKADPKLLELARLSLVWGESELVQESLRDA